MRFLYLFVFYLQTINLYCQPSEYYPTHPPIRWEAVVECTTWELQFQLSYRNNSIADNPYVDGCNRMWHARITKGDDPNLTAIWAERLFFMGPERPFSDCGAVQSALWISGMVDSIDLRVDFPALETTTRWEWMMMAPYLTTALVNGNDTIEIRWKRVSETQNQVDVFGAGINALMQQEVLPEMHWFDSLFVLENGHYYMETRVLPCGVMIHFKDVCWIEFMDGSCSTGQNGYWSFYKKMQFLPQEKNPAIIVFVSKFYIAGLSDTDRMDVDGQQTKHKDAQNTFTYQVWELEAKEWRLQHTSNNLKVQSGEQLYFSRGQLYLNKYTSDTVITRRLIWDGDSKKFKTLE